MKNNYYVYQLVDPRTNLPFYIGEGKGKRAQSHSTFKSGCNNPHKDRVIRKIQSEGLEVIVIIIKENLSKIEAQECEKELILNIGLNNLTNICVDANPPILKGQSNGFYQKTHTEENKIKMGSVNKGKDLKTIEGKKAISESLKERWRNPDQRKKQIDSLKSRKGEKRSRAAIEAYKKAASQRDANMSPEQRSARSKAGAETKKLKYAGLKRKSFIDENGKKRFKYVPE